MDLQLNSAAEPGGAPGGMPPSAAEHPAQDLRYKPWWHERRLISAAVFTRFIIAVTVGDHVRRLQMLQVVRRQHDVLQGTMIFFFASPWAGSPSAGSIGRRLETRDPLARATLAGTMTALVMPIWRARTHGGGVAGDGEHCIAATRMQL